MQKIKNIISPHEKSDDVTGSSNTGVNRSSSGSYGTSSAENRLAGAAADSRLSGTGTTGVTTGNRVSEVGTAGNRLSGSGLAGSNTTSGLSGTNTTSGLTGSNTSSGLTGGNASSGLTGQNSAVSGSTGNTAGQGHGLFGNHQIGHNSKPDAKFDPSGENVTHEHQHLNHVTHRDVRHQEVEEVQRERDHHRHVHHIQHHVQPVHDKQVQDEVHHNKAHPVTNISEKHANTTEDRKLYDSLGERHRDQETHRAKERTVVDLGERVNETTHHHVHHVTQPVVEQEVHDRHRIHTTIPLTHTVHEAPIIHKSSVHEPVHMSDFLKGGGKLGSGITHDKANVLQDGDCERSVDGIGEKLTEELNLKPSTLNRSGGQTVV